MLIQYLLSGEEQTFFNYKYWQRTGLESDKSCPPSTCQALIHNQFLAFVDETTMLNGNCGYKEASPCHYSMN